MTVLLMVHTCGVACDCGWKRIHESCFVRRGFMNRFSATGYEVARRDEVRRHNDWASHRSSGMHYLGNGARITLADHQENSPLQSKRSSTLYLYCDSFACLVLLSLSTFFLCWRWLVEWGMRMSQFDACLGSDGVDSWGDENFGRGCAFCGCWCVLVFGWIIFYEIVIEDDQIFVWYLCERVNYQLFLKQFYAN